MHVLTGMCTNTVLFLAIDNIQMLFMAFQWPRKPSSAYLFVGIGWFLADVGAHPLSESFFFSRNLVICPLKAPLDNIL